MILSPYNNLHYSCRFWSGRGDWLFGAVDREELVDGCGGHFRLRAVLDTGQQAVGQGLGEQIDIFFDVGHWQWRRPLHVPGAVADKQQILRHPNAKLDDGHGHFR